MSRTDEAFLWQVGVWDRMSEAYVRQIDDRFAPVIERCMHHAALRSGQSVIDLGTGTGSIAIAASRVVGSAGHVTAVDVSPDMIQAARRRLENLAIENVEVVEGRAEAIPSPAESADALIASLSLMYVVDRDTAAKECARVLRRGGTFVGAVWAGPQDSDIVRFQQIAGSYAPPPPVSHVGPGALADPTSFVEALDAVGITAGVVSELTEFTFPDLESAWSPLAGVTTANLDPTDLAAAKAAVREAMWEDAESPRVFRNLTHFIVGERVS